MQEINAKNIYYRDLNKQIRDLIAAGERKFIVKNVNGQRYFLDGIRENVEMDIYGIPGQDMGAFMDGPTIRVFGDGQDGIANTMSNGKIIIHGIAGDVCGYGMRGGKLFIKEDAGYRIGIHMKEYLDKTPIIVVGGKVGDFFGEYMAGGIMVVIGMFSRKPNDPVFGDYLGTGMHGGRIYVRGEVDPFFCGKECGIEKVNAKDDEKLRDILKEFCDSFSVSYKKLIDSDFTMLWPKTTRPYGNLYAY
jgi:glutamate synthase domain-containing protein 3